MRVIENILLFILMSVRSRRCSVLIFLDNRRSDFYKKYRLTPELDVAWMMRSLRLRATTLLAILWFMASMVVICCIQLFQISVTVV